MIAKRLFTYIISKTYTLESVAKLKNPVQFFEDEIKCLDNEFRIKSIDYFTEGSINESIFTDRQKSVVCCEKLDAFKIQSERDKKDEKLYKDLENDLP